MRRHRTRQNRWLAHPHRSLLWRLWRRPASSSAQERHGAAVLFSFSKPVGHSGTMPVAGLIFFLPIISHQSLNTCRLDSVASFFEEHVRRHAGKHRLHQFLHSSFFKKRYIMADYNSSRSFQFLAVA